MEVHRMTTQDTLAIVFGIALNVAIVGILYLASSGYIA